MKVRRAALITWSGRASLRGHLGTDLRISRSLAIEELRKGCSVWRNRRCKGPEAGIAPDRA